MLQSSTAPALPVLPSTVSPADIALIEINTCCDAIVRAYNAHLSQAVKRLLEPPPKRAYTKRKTPAHHKPVTVALLAERAAERRRCQIERNKKRATIIEAEQERALNCLREDPVVSVETCIAHFTPPEVDNRDEEIIFASEHVLPLVRKLKTLFHIARAYPGEVRKRCDRLKAAAASDYTRDDPDDE